MKFVLLLLLAFFGYNAQSQFAERVKQTDTMIVAPDFTVIDTDSNLLNLYNTLDSGNVVVLDFFTTTCGPCSYYAPVIEYFYQHDVVGSANIKLWGIDVYSNNADVIAYKINNGITNPCASGLDGGGQVVFQNYNNLYGYHGTPTYAVVSPSKRVYWNVNYPPSKDGFDIYISNSLPNTKVKANEFYDESIHVYPNPANTNIQIEYLDGLNTYHHIELFNQLGKSMFATSKPDLIDREKFSIPIHDFPPGIYVLRFSDDNLNFVCKKIIIQ